MDARMKTFGEVSQFTPLFDEIIKKYDRKIAAVYGRIWRRCQGKYECCSESLTNMAKELKMSKKTIRDAIKTLVDASEIFPEKRTGKTTLYRITPTKTGMGTFDTPTKTGMTPLPKRVHEDTNKTEPNSFKKREQLIKTAKEHFSLGPTRDKSLDDYYLGLIGE